MWNQYSSFLESYDFSGFLFSVVCLVNFNDLLDGALEFGQSLVLDFHFSNLNIGSQPHWC